MIAHSRPTLDEDDAAAVGAVLGSGRLSQGKAVAEFEQALSSTIGVRSGVALSSGTSALHLSLLALRIGTGDEVVIPSYVCTALLNAVRYVSATPIVCDIDPATFNLSPEDLRKKITARTKAIILPHMFGLPADLDDILSLGIPVVEDCALSLGSHYRKRLTGGIGTLSVFSFYATKVIATGEGGMVLSDREDLLEIVRDLRDYDEKEAYAVRYNYKMTDLQAALGTSQLRKLPTFLARRREIAALYRHALEPLGVSLPEVPSDRDHIFYRYILRVNRPANFIEAMREGGVDCRRPVFRPLHRYLGLKGYPLTEEAWKRAVSIPIYPSLRDGEVREIVEKAKTLL
jgi:dTDP-4-amino-4,6-dideoxygalactose transaminase